MVKNKYNLYTFQTNKMFDIEKLANSNPDLFNELCDKYKVKNNEAVFAVIYKKEEQNVSVDNSNEVKTEPEVLKCDDEPTGNLPEPVDPLHIFNTELRKGSNVQSGKYRIYHYYKICGIKDFDKFLSKEYGEGGWSGPGLPSVWFNAKGLRIDFRDGSEEQFFNWKSVAAQIKKLIDEGKYMTDKELETYKRDPMSYIPVHNKGADDEDDNLDDLPDEAYECDDEVVEVTEEFIADNKVVHSVDYNLTTLEGVLAYFTANGYANGNHYEGNMFDLVVETEEFNYLYNERITGAKHRLLKLNDFYFVVEGHMDGMFNAPYLTDKTSLKDVEYKYITRQKTPLYPENFAPLFNVGENVKVEYNLGRNKETISILAIKLIKDHDNLVGYAYECISAETAEERIFTEEVLCEIEVE